METKELIDKLEEYIELGHKFKTYELLKAAVRKIKHLEAECERLKKNYDGLIADAAKNGYIDCVFCKHNTLDSECVGNCEACKLDGCACRECREYSNVKWRGEA